MNLKGEGSLLYDDYGGINDDDSSINESLTQSYNQKVKDDTNFLAKKKNLYYDDSNPGENRKRKDDSSKDADILYNLQMRPSYDQLPG